jgi:hypothetical protein
VTDKTARLMVLVDGENFHVQHVDELLKVATNLGTIVEVRVYAHFLRTNHYRWREECSKRGFTAIDVELVGSNTADFRLTIEAVDMLHMRMLDAFLIASSDVDFASLVVRMRSAALPVYCIGAENSALKEVCNEFFPLSKPRLEAILESIKELAMADGWTPLGRVGQIYKTKSLSSYRLSTFIRKELAGRVEFHPQDGNKIRLLPSAPAEARAA